MVRSIGPIIDIFRYDPVTKSQDLVISSMDGFSRDKIKDTVALQTYDAARSVVDYFKSSFHRDSFDGKNAPVKIVIGYREEPSVPLSNAFWSQEDKTIYFGDGDGRVITPLGTAPDVMAHEFTHAVIDSVLLLKYRGEQGGIHESVSDVLATGVDGNLTIGESIFTPDLKGDSIRDLADLPLKTKNDLPKYSGTIEGEPHMMSEPLSTAAFLASKVLGIEKIRQIWYTAVTQGLKDNAGFEGLRSATEGAALSLYGTKARQSIADAWKAVGI